MVLLTRHTTVPVRTAREQRRVAVTLSLDAGLRITIIMVVPVTGNPLASRRMDSMSDQQRCPVVQFDHHSAEHAKDHVAIYRKLREETPVAWTEAHGGFWVLSSYQAVFEASRDDDTFSSRSEEHTSELQS